MTDFSLMLEEVRVPEIFSGTSDSSILPALELNIEVVVNQMALLFVSKTLTMMQRCTTLTMSIAQVQTNFIDKTLTPHSLWSETESILQ